MDIGIFFTVVGSAVGIVALIYTIVRNFKNDFDSKFIILEERIFQLAMGKSFREILKSEKEEAGNKEG